MQINNNQSVKFTKLSFNTLKNNVDNLVLNPGDSVSLQNFDPDRIVYGIPDSVFKDFCSAYEDANPDRFVSKHYDYEVCFVSKNSYLVNKPNKFNIDDSTSLFFLGDTCTITFESNPATNRPEQYLKFLVIGHNKIFWLSHIAIEFTLIDFYNHRNI